MQKTVPEGCALYKKISVWHFNLLTVSFIFVLGFDFGSDSCVSKFGICLLCEIRVSLKSLSYEQLLFSFYYAHCTNCIKPCFWIPTINQYLQFQGIRAYLYCRMCKIFYVKRHGYFSLLAQHNQNQTQDQKWRKMFRIGKRQNTEMPPLFLLRSAHSSETDFGILSNYQKSPTIFVKGII